MSWFAILKNDKSGFYYGKRYNIELPEEVERMMMYLMIKNIMLLEKNIKKQKGNILKLKQNIIKNLENNK